MGIFKSNLVQNTKKALAFAFSVACISGCIHFPRNSKYARTPFSLNEYSRSAETKLDTSSYYFNEWESFRKTGNVNIVDVMKFYSDGRFEFRSFEGQAYTKEMGDTLKDFIHYYKIEKGILKLEVYMNSMEGFSHWKGKIYADSIVFFTGPGIRHLVFKKKELH